jgi:hypothetical protein
MYFYNHAHTRQIRQLWKDTVLAIREKSGWIQCRGTKPLLINLSLSTFNILKVRQQADSSCMTHPVAGSVMTNTSCWGV